MVNLLLGTTYFLQEKLNEMNVHKNGELDYKRNSYTVDPRYLDLAYLE